MRHLLACSALCLLPLSAFAADRCAHAAPRTLALDLDGVRTVVFEIGNSALRLDAARGGGAGVTGRACASDADLLPQLRLTQARSGDRLVVRAERSERGAGFGWGDRYAYMALAATVPAGMAVALDVGSGDAWVTGVASLALEVGSGDAEVRRVPGAVTAQVGSGDVTIDEVGSLDVGSVGSGDLSVRRVRAGVEVGSIGSGDLELATVGGDVRIASIGSGDATVREVGGDVVLGSIGSGDLEVAAVKGGLTVRSSGSGSVEHAGVAGAVSLPKRR
ncbi:MAG TPA: hypothetical protein VLK29_01740 [Luteimonas sp.]|nr:hypothetical protein [Luteimonas sp.]